VSAINDGRRRRRGYGDKANGNGGGGQHVLVADIADGGAAVVRQYHEYYKYDRRVDECRGNRMNAESTGEWMNAEATVEECRGNRWMNAEAVDLGSEWGHWQVHATKTPNQTQILLTPANTDNADASKRRAAIPKPLLMLLTPACSAVGVSSTRSPSTTANTNPNPFPPDPRSIANVRNTGVSDFRGRESAGVSGVSGVDGAVGASTRGGGVRMTPICTGCKNRAVRSLPANNGSVVVCDVIKVVGRMHG
jgi:hypothetical protein